MYDKSMAHFKKTIRVKYFALDRPLALSGGSHSTSLKSRNGMKRRILPKRTAMYRLDSRVRRISYASSLSRGGIAWIDKQTDEVSPFQVYLQPVLRGRTGVVKADAIGLSTGHEHFLDMEKEAKGMAKIKTKRVRWDSSVSPDVAGYKLYWAIGQGVNYDSDAAEVGNVNSVILPDEIPSFPRVAGDIEIGVTALNYKGNESDMSVCSAPFDFTAPEAPLNLVVEDT
jgi:hypothetical protein